MIPKEVYEMAEVLYIQSFVGTNPPFRFDRISATEQAPWFEKAQKKLDMVKKATKDRSQGEDK